MAKQSKKKVVEEQIPAVTETAAPIIETLPTADVTEQQDLAELEGIGELDVNDRYKGIEVKEGRILLEQVGTGKEYPPFIIVNALKVKLHPDGTATVNGYLTDGKSNIYKVIKKKA